MTELKHHHTHPLLRALTSHEPERFTFDPRRHAYYVDGVVLPVVDLATPTSEATRRLEAAIAKAIDDRRWRHTLTRHDDGTVSVNVYAPHGTYSAKAPRPWLAAGGALIKAAKDLRS